MKSPVTPPRRGPPNLSCTHNPTDSTDECANAHLSLCVSDREVMECVKEEEEVHV